jgi:hypothetical protein
VDIGLDLVNIFFKQNDQEIRGILAKVGHYSQDNGRPSKPIRLMVGLLLLKQLENLSDERVVLQFKRNPYYQYFCGYSNYS